MRFSNLMFLLTAAALLPAPGLAQRIESARFAVVQPSADTARLEKPPASRQRVFWMRSLSGTAGMAAGFYSGWMIGRYYTPRRHLQDWTTLSDQEAIGMLSGALAGAALGAAILKYDSKCSGQTRFLRGLAGAAVGFVPAVILGPFGPGMGAAAFQGHC